MQMADLSFSENGERLGRDNHSIQAIGALKDKDNLAGSLEVAGMGGFPFTAIKKQ